MNGRIKVFNETNHGHTVRLLLENGNYSHRRLTPRKNGRKTFAFLTEDQFLDLWMSTRDFSDGYLSYDADALSDEVKQALGLPLTAEEAEDYIPEFKVYTDEDILKIVKAGGKKGNEAFDEFASEIAELEEKHSGELKRRIFNIAKEAIEGLTKKRADAIETLTGKNFIADEQLENENK